ncbi:MAG: dihydrodipicolinate synthase family protein [Gemmataceae bacterium]
MNAELHGLVAATYTPFDPDGRLNLDSVEEQAEHLARTGVSAVFIGGTTGECMSLTMDERTELAGRWGDVVRASPLRLVVHVGSNCLEDSRLLAAHAQAVGAAAVAAFSPSYFKPRSLDVLIDCCAGIASAAPGVPFYFYDIPTMTGVGLSMPDFLEAAPEKIPTLAGLKFTNADLMAYQRCLHAGGGRFDLPWGMDEVLLAALSVGAKGAVGSTYNFAAPVYRRLMAAFAAGDLAAARREQYRSVQLVALLSGYGFMGAARALMGFLGVDVGRPRLPFTPLADEDAGRLRGDLDRLGFFDWVRG